MQVEDGGQRARFFEARRGRPVKLRVRDRFNAAGRPNKSCAVRQWAPHLLFATKAAPLPPAPLGTAPVGSLEHVR